MTEYAGQGTDDDRDDSSRRPGDHAKLTDDQQIERLDRQIKLILESIDGAAAHFTGRPGELDYLYIKGRILVRDADLDRVSAVVPGQVIDALVNGLSVYEPANLGTLEALATIDAALGVGVATPDHIFHVTPASGCCPATEPDPAGSSPHPALVPPGSGHGAGTVVSIVDTGWLPFVGAQHGWLAGVTGDVEHYNAPHLGPYIGHGTFVAGVVRSVAPDAQIHVDGFLTNGGAITESAILRNLHKAVERSPDIISMSAGCTTRHNLPPLGFEVLWTERLRHCKGTVLVAAAGNNSSRRPFWPAAFEWAVSVGSIDADGRRSDFSDFGSWVDVYALGRDIINAYPDGIYTYNEPPRVGEQVPFTTGLASWSGTSFSTPMVAGMISARMSRTGQSGRQAADSILRIARLHAEAGVGAIAEASTALDIDPRGY